MCPLKPTAQSFFGLTVVPLGARFVPRNFDENYVLIFQYVGIGLDSVGIRWCQTRSFTLRGHQQPIAGTSPESRVKVGGCGRRDFPHSAAHWFSSRPEGEDSLVVVSFRYCSFHTYTPSQEYRAALIAAQEKGTRPTATIDVDFDRVTSVSKVESTKGDLGESEWFLTADKGLTAKLAECCGSLSLVLEERQKSRAKRGAPWKYRKTCQRQNTFVALFFLVRMVHLILAIPVPQIQEQNGCGARCPFSLSCSPL